MDKILVECDDAGVDGSCEGDVELTVCPYEEELHNIQVPAWLCEFHYEQRCREL